MSLLNSILGQVSGNATVENLAAKVGMSPDQVESAVTALGQAHGAEGDTVETAAANTGLPADKLQEIISHIGGEGSLGQFASLLQGDRANGILGASPSSFEAFGASSRFNFCAEPTAQNQRRLNTRRPFNAYSVCSCGPIAGRITGDSRSPLSERPRQVRQMHQGNEVGEGDPNTLPQRQGSFRQVQIARAS